MYLKPRYRRFVENVIQVLGEIHEPIGSEAFAELVAARMVTKMGWIGMYGMPMNPKTALRRVKALLANEQITAGIREAFDIGANFTMVDALGKMRDWIEGNVEHDGEKLPPSLEALKTYFKMTLPVQAKQVNVNQQTLVARVNLSDQAPPILPRSIETIEQLPPPEDV